MYAVKTPPEFRAWLKGLADKTAQGRLVARLRKASLGNLGDVRPIGGGLFEMREHFGPGWRMYFVRRGTQLIIMVGGGDKDSQQKDIAAARRRAARIADD